MIKTKYSTSYTQGFTRFFYCMFYWITDIIKILTSNQQWLEKKKIKEKKKSDKKFTRCPTCLEMSVKKPVLYKVNIVSYAEHITRILNSFYMFAQAYVDQYMYTTTHKLAAITTLWGYSFVLSVIKVPPQCWWNKCHHCVLLFKYSHKVDLTSTYAQLTNT